MSDAAPQQHYKQNRLQQLRGFCTAVQAGGVSKAARRLLLSQPTVSLQIQALERELGVKLFERRGPKIRLTPDGQALYELASPMVESIDRLPETFAGRHGELHGGRLDVAAGEATILYMLPRHVKRFGSAHPDVELKLHNVTGRDGLVLLRQGEVDLAVGSMLDVPRDIAYYPIETYEPVLITARRHPLARRRKVTLREISRYPLILPPRSLTTSPLVDMAFKRESLPYNVRMEVGGWEVIKRYVELDLGVSIVTSICLRKGDRLAAIPLSGVFPTRSYGVVLRKGRTLSAQARRFIELLSPDVARKL